MPRVNLTTLQNRVDPFGGIHAVPERGTMFGNRGGCMHTPDQLLRGRPWTNERWICCLLQFKDRHREVMQPRLYTELFFLDEATALAAGHRPCMECRRGDAQRFVAAWAGAHLRSGQRLASISQIDRLAHVERVVAKTRTRVTARAHLSLLPDGVFVTLDDQPEQPLLLAGGRLHPWSFGGYAPPIPAPSDGQVTLLTPPSFARTFAAGYTPAVHPSAAVS